MKAAIMEMQKWVSFPEKKPISGKDFSPLICYT